MNINDYLQLIPPPNRIQPKFMAWLKESLLPVQYTQDLNINMYLQFMIDTGVGVQLDVLGDILQVARQVTFLPEGGLSPVLSDDLYRLVLRAKVLINQWDGTTKQIYDFWNKYLPQYAVIIIDNQDMTETILVGGMKNDIGDIRMFGFDIDDDETTGFDGGYWEPVNSMLRQLVLHNYLFPKPAGVRINYAFIDDPLFAFDLETEFFKGFDEGVWFDPIAFIP